MNDNETINQDYSKRIVLNTNTELWHDSPSKGVKRIYLERNNMGEYATASSIVKFDSNSSFDSHAHENGEEFFVLDGIFSDQYGDYSKDTYVRNPHNSKHKPYSKSGCMIFVKLRQFQKNDVSRVVKDTSNFPWLPGLVPGLSVMSLHEYKSEHVAMVKWEPNTQFTQHQHWGGEEILVIEGVFYDEHGMYPKGTWIRSPHMSSHKPFTKNEGALIFVKTGHMV